jgi:hypothetical protein
LLSPLANLRLNPQLSPQLNRLVNPPGNLPILRVSGLIDPTASLVGQPADVVRARGGMPMLRKMRI